jgi:cyclomaltodextrinase
MAEHAERELEDFIFGTTNFSQERTDLLRKRLGGVVHAYRTEPIAPKPGDVVTVRLWVGDEQPVDRSCCYYTTDGKDPQGQRGQARQGQAVAMSALSVEWVDLRWSFGRWWTCQLPPQPEGTLVRYRLEAYSSLGGESVWADGGALFSYLCSSMTPPDWAPNAVIYHVFVDRFYPGDGRPWLKPDKPTGFYGGALQGVIDKLDYVADLGATTIWLSPIFASPSHHGYDCTDYYQVEPRYGDNETLRRLVQQAHARGLRILLDFVPNHCSHLHPFFREAQQNRNSPYYNWFTFTRWPNDYASFFGVKSLPQWNLNNPDTRRYIIGAACHWLQEYGVAHEFWADFHRAVRQAAPDSFCIAEAVESPEVMRTYSGRLEGCLDFPFLQAVRQAFGHDSLDVARLDAFLAQRAAYFGDGLVLGTFLDNHDMNRFLWLVGSDKRKLKLAALFQFTLPSPPIVYYGTEIGIVQSGDVQGLHGNAFHHHARTPMPWDAQDGDLLSYYRRLGALRRDHVALREGRRATLHVDAAAGTYAYACCSQSDCVIVALNNSDALHTLVAPVASVGVPDGVELRDALSGCLVRVASGQLAIKLEARSGAALVVA